MSFQTDVGPIEMGRKDTGWITWDGSQKSTPTTFSANAQPRTYNDGWPVGAAVDEVGGKGVLMYSKGPSNANGAPIYAIVVEATSTTSLSLKTEAAIYASNAFSYCITMLTTSTGIVNFYAPDNKPYYQPITVNTSTDVITTGSATLMYNGSTYDSSEVLVKLSSTTALAVRSDYSAYPQYVTYVTYGASSVTVPSVEYNSGPNSANDGNSVAVLSSTRAMQAACTNEASNVYFKPINLSGGTVTGVSTGGTYLSNVKGGHIVALTSTKSLFVYAKSDSSYQVACAMVTDNGGNNNPTVGTPVVPNTGFYTRSTYLPISHLSAVLMEVKGTKAYIFIAATNDGDSDYPTGMVVEVDTSSNAITHVATARLYAEATSSAGRIVSVMKLTDKIACVYYLNSSNVGKVLVTGVN